MVEEIATVVATEKNGVWLSTTPVTSCQACQVNSSCGSGAVAKALTPRAQRFFVPTPLSLLPGEQVKIGLAETGIVKAALMVYLLPLLLMLLAILAIYWAWPQAEVLQLLAALAGAAAGFMLARYYNNRQATLSEQICIVEVLPQLGIQPQSAS